MIQLYRDFCPFTLAVPLILRFADDADDSEIRLAEPKIFGSIRMFRDSVYLGRHKVPQTPVFRSPDEYVTFCSVSLSSFIGKTYDPAPVKRVSRYDLSSNPQTILR
jgi:hypothetical protein